MSLRALCRPPPATAIDGSDFACLPALVRGSRSTGPVVELWEIERPCPLLAAPRENLEFRREPLIEAIESASLHEHGPREVLQVVGEHPGTAVGTEDAIEPLARTCFGIRTVGEALGVSAEHGEIRVRHRPECRHLSAGRPLAIRAVAVCDESRLGIESVRHLAAGTVTGVLLAHVISSSQKRRHSNLTTSTSCTEASFNLSIRKPGTFQIPVDNFQETSGGSRMLIRKQNRYDSSTSPPNQRQHDEVYQTPGLRSPDPYRYRQTRLAVSRCLRENDANRTGLPDIADLSLSTPCDGKHPVGNAL